MTTPSTNEALAALIHELVEEGAITVRTPMGAGPAHGGAASGPTPRPADAGPELAAVTILGLGGGVVVKVHPDLTEEDARWQQHRRDVAARLEPLGVLRAWTDKVARIEAIVRRVIAIAAALAAPIGAATSESFARLIQSVVIPPSLALLAPYVVRPLLTRLVGRGLRRALRALAGRAPVDPGRVV